MSELSNKTIRELNESSHNLLQELVTSEGIYASAAQGWEGPYHAWFGRDGAITADLIFASLEYGGDRQLAGVALSALKNYAQWQGACDDVATGERRGKLPHEVRTEFIDTSSVQHAARTNEKPWYVDPADNTLKNWDTADGTSLWVLATLRGHDALGEVISDAYESDLKEALRWIVSATKQYDGMVAFIGADLQDGRVYSGLHNQGWKDTTDVYQRPESGNAAHPIKDVLVNAEAWSALTEGARYFREKDSDFYNELQAAADTLQALYNSCDEGFVLSDGSGLAQAIDGHGDQLTQSAVDQGAVLWTRTEEGSLVINDEMERIVAERIMSNEMFNPDAGIRDYALGTEFTHGTNYHGSSHTYWPFMSGMTARGLERAGYRSEAKQVMGAYLNAVKTLGTNIEMFVQDDDDSFEPWSHPDPEIGQKSSREQAWTAAAVYYATQYLESTNK